LRQQREGRLQLKAIAARQKNAPRQLITQASLARFCSAAREKLAGGTVGYRKSYLRLFVERVEVDEGEVRLIGHKDALEAGLASAGEVPAEVLTSVRQWRPQRDSNPCYQRERLVS
jgi:site-specific DNA recombinase